MRGCSPKWTTRAANSRPRIPSCNGRRPNCSSRPTSSSTGTGRWKSGSRNNSPRSSASAGGHDSLLDSHRREVTVVFCDLRGFTAFTETTEPEEAMNVLREYHAALGELIFKYEGTLDRYAGDGVMILFNAPIQFADHTKRAVKMSTEMRDTIGQLTERWRNRGHNLGFGIGIALGYATLGQIGFEQRLEYAAIGSVTNLASRLCDEAKAGQIVVSRRVYGMVEEWVEGRPIDDLTLKGFNHPILAAEILAWRDEVDNVVEASSAAARRQKKQ